MPVMPHVHVGWRHHKVFLGTGRALVLLPENWQSDQYAIVARSPDDVVGGDVILFQYIDVD